MRENRMAAMAALLCGLAVTLGALGAHALRGKLEPQSLDSFEAAVRYQMWHGLALLMVSLGCICRNLPGLNLVRWLMLGGTVLFSGSIYLLSTKSLHGWEALCRIAGPVTPIGGMLMISAWLLLAARLFRK